MKLLTAFIASWALIIASNAAAQEIFLPTPEGPYAIGYGAVTFATGTDDALTRRVGDKRKLHLEIWYPSEPGGEAKPYATPFISKSLFEDFPFPDNFADEIAVSSHSGAPPAEGTFPVILFSHGLSWPVSLYQSLTEDIASRGYIVIGVNHPHGAAVDFGDGETRGRSDWPDISDEKQRQAMLSEQADVWADDLKAVIDALRKNPQNVSDSYLAGANVRRIGVFGHSLGGTAAGRVTDHPGVAAVAAMEGNARMPEGAARRVGAPFLHLIGGYNRLELEGDFYAPSKNAPVFQIIVNGTGHAYFADLIYLYKHYADQNWLRRHRYETEPARVIQITRDYLAGFFDHYLKGEPRGVLLNPVSYAAKADSPGQAGYPEVEIAIFVD